MVRFLLIVLSVALVFGPVATAGAQAPASVLRLTVQAGAVAELAGHGPLRGTIEVRRTPAGLAVINELDLEEYVMGVREVPGMWPMEALKAQAVAARTYALWEKLTGRHQATGFDICPTVSCQVYTGAEAEAEERGQRWVEAVRSTAGQVLLYGDGPALTRYHSSSGGRTAPNHAVFGARLPYLSGIDDPDDAASPLHRWTFDVPLDVLDALFRPEGFTAPLTGLRDDPGSLVVEAEDGEFGIDHGRFRAVLNEQGPQRFPDRFPGTRADGKPKPLTLPSGRFDIIVLPEGGIRVEGRGYGHGVGMSQYGAFGRASRGESYTQILGAYYGGLQPQPWTGDRTIRVGLIESTPEVRVSSAAPIADQIGPPRIGEWVVKPASNGTLAIDGPPMPPPPPTPEPTPEAVVPVTQAAVAAEPLPAPASRDPRTTAVATFLIAAAMVLSTREPRIGPIRTRGL